MPGDKKHTRLCNIAGKCVVGTLIPSQNQPTQQTRKNRFKTSVTFLGWYAQLLSKPTYQPTNKITRNGTKCNFLKYLLTGDALGLDRLRR
jgi:hypothetical protein